MSTGVRVLTLYLSLILFLKYIVYLYMTRDIQNI